MSTSSISSSSTQPLPTTSNPLKPSAKIQDAADCLFTIFKFLTPIELSRAERTCQSWRKMISSPDQYAWKQQCEVQGVAQVKRAVENILMPYSSKNVSTGFTSTLISLITAYEELDENYKDFAKSIRGNIQLYGLGGDHIHIYEKNEPLSGILRWGNNDPEPFLLTTTWSNQSLQMCEALHIKCKHTGLQGTWHDIHPRIRGAGFPRRVPLRLFINTDGRYKEAGDQLRLRYQGQFIVLTLIHPEGQHRSGLPLRTFAAGIEARVQSSLNCNFLSETQLNQAKAAAATISGEWISSD